MAERRDGSGGVSQAKGRARKTSGSRARKATAGNGAGKAKPPRKPRARRAGSAKAAKAKSGAAADERRATERRPVGTLLHDTVEDTSASLEEVDEHFGDEIASLVDGVTKLTGITFQSRDEAQAENYRKMMVAMASDIRVILIKLADRLHNMRTIDALPKQKQIDKAKETLDIYGPIAHRLGIHAIKWELEDLAFSTLHPRKYTEIKSLVAQQRAERERYVNQAGAYLNQELDGLGINRQISGRAKHFYSIYSKMTKKGREFNEI